MVCVTDVFPHNATLIRKMDDGKELQVKLNVSRISKGKDPNIMLAAGDILWVPDTLATRVEDWCNKNLFMQARRDVQSGLQHAGYEYLNAAARNSGCG